MWQSPQLTLNSDNGTSLIAKEMIVINETVNKIEKVKKVKLSL
jgi:hypothetical protein